MIDILMPRLSDTMTEGTIAAWHKRAGEAITAGELLLEVETDKALMEQEAYEAGTLTEILVAEGETVAIGTPIARLDDGSGSDAPDAQADAAPVPGGRIPATPLVRKLAREHRIDLGTVTGTGPGGRIVRADLEAHLADRAVAQAPAAAPAATPAGPAPEPASAHAPDPAPVPDPEPAPDPVSTPAPGSGSGSGGPRASSAVPFDGIRHAVAARLTESATTIPTFTVTASARIDELLALRASMNAALTDARVSVNDLLVRAVALALRAHPGMNASYSPAGRGETLVHGRVHVGVAVASPAGLVVPVIRDADRAAVTAISAATRDLVGRASSRSLTSEHMSGGTFTVSNLGMYGVEHFTAIINPPEGAILAVGAATEELGLDADGAVERRTRLRYTLTSDHRIIDGALAAEFLRTLTSLLEAPLRIVA